MGRRKATIFDKLQVQRRPSTDSCRGLSVANFADGFIGVTAGQFQPFAAAGQCLTIACHPSNRPHRLGRDAGGVGAVTADIQIGRVTIFCTVNEQSSEPNRGCRPGSKEAGGTGTDDDEVVVEVRFAREGPCLG